MEKTHTTVPAAKAPEAVVAKPTVIGEPVAPVVAKPVRASVAARKETPYTAAKGSTEGKSTDTAYVA